VTRIQVRVTPRAVRNEVAGVGVDGTVHVRVIAPPADGKANAAVSRLLATALDIPPSRLTLVSGAASRRKSFAVEGMDAAALDHLLKRMSGGSTGATPRR
jgi:hypothetical protein